MNPKKIDRSKFEEAMIALIYSKDQFLQQSFWAFIISDMEIELSRVTNTLGVGFINNRFKIVINPDFFNPLPIEQRVGVLIHEAQHVVLKHMHRKGQRDHKLFNAACDIALNQNIKREWLPDSALYPDKYRDKNGNVFPPNLTAEDYYVLLKEKGKEKGKDSKCGEGEGEGEGESSDGDGDGEEFDDHSMWDELSEADEELANQIMEASIKGAVSKAKGTATLDVEKLLELWRREPKISWKKVLKRYISSKIGGKRKTIRRKDRRQPGRTDLKGQRVYRDRPEIIVGIDTSGSMSNDAINEALVEINALCELTKTSLKTIQIDTTIKSVEAFDPKKKSWNRRGYGGTYMGALPKYLTENKIPADVLIMISDMYIENLTTDENWCKYKTPVLWLSTSGRIPTLPRKHKLFDIKKV